MFARQLPVNKMNYAHATQHQRISDQTAVAMFRQTFGAHDCNRFALRQIQQLRDATLEVRRAHVIHETARGVVQ